MKRNEYHQSIKRALISVANKSGVVEFASQLARQGVELIATQGTAALLKQHGIPLTEVTQITGVPEILSGRLKTLHYKLLGGLLAHRDRDRAELQKHDILPIDLLVANLYPFEEKAHHYSEDVIEYIDVGGPSLLRAAAKNFEFVTVVMDPDDYSKVIHEMKEYEGATTQNTRKQFSQKVFSQLSHYDTIIANHLNDSVDQNLFPERLTLNFKKKSELRYGENPHQRAALYHPLLPLTGMLEAELLQGAPLTYNNYVDAHCAYQCVNVFLNPACAIVKHATPCGAAEAETLPTACEKAYHADPISAYGGIVAVNRCIDAETANVLNKHFWDVIIAPGFTSEARQFFENKSQTRLWMAPPFSPTEPGWSIQTINGGLLVQEEDQTPLIQDFQVVSQRSPTPNEMQDLLFAWNIVKYAKSNAIVCARERVTVGIGAGQTSRVFAVKMAFMKAEEGGMSLRGAVMASDAFFPFNDSIKLAEAAGITAIIQPGGSKRDSEVIQAANDAHMAMILTGTRHFRH